MISFRRRQLGAHAVDDRRDDVHALGHRVGPARALFLVDEVEADDAEAARAKRVRGSEHGTIGHVAAGAVAHDVDHFVARPDVALS